MTVATALCEKGVALCHQLGDKESHSWFAHYLGFVASAQGDYARAAALHEEGLALSRELGDKAMMGFGLAQLGRTAWRQGDRERATSLSSDGLALGKEVEDKWVTAYALCNLGTVALDRGGYEQAGAFFSESLVECGEVGDRLDTQRCLEGLAAVACVRGDYRRSARLFGAAQMLRERFVHIPLAPADRAQLDRHVLTLRAGLDETAFAASWTEGWTMRLEEAVEYARNPDQPARRTIKGTEPSMLTPREREVVPMIAKGLTNREIAARLVVSERTAETHVQNILNKLGFTSRAQVAAWAVEQGLHTPTKQ